MDTGMGEEPAAARVREAAAPLDRRRFLRTPIREWSGALEDGVGLKKASGHISLVGADHFRGSQA